MQPVVLFRKAFSKFSNFDEEFSTCQKYFQTYEVRSDIPADSIVIGRYSVLPYYKELCQDLANTYSYLVNAHRMHQWIASFNWYTDIVSQLGQQITPKSWNQDSFSHNAAGDGPFIVKGATNSRKHEWNSMMYAKNFREAIEISCKLRKDSLISSQDIIFRQYVPLETFETGIDDLPFTNEWRFFCYKDKVLCSGYYWSTAECAEYMIDTPVRAQLLAKDLAKTVSKFANFFVLDIAKTQSDDWILIEINDGQMSGLNTISAETLYKSLAEAVNV